MQRNDISNEKELIESHSKWEIIELMLTYAHKRFLMTRAFDIRNLAIYKAVLRGMGRRGVWPFNRLNAIRMSYACAYSN